MEHQLNNPLRSSIKPTQKETPKSDPILKEEKKIPLEETIVVKKAEPLKNKPSPPPVLHPKVQKTLEALNKSDDLRQLLDKLAESGLEIVGPKKNFIKHSYEIDEEIHRRFHEMYPVLGYKKVKDAINAALFQWCEQNEAEYQRRSGNKK